MLKKIIGLGLLTVTFSACSVPGLNIGQKVQEKVQEQAQNQVQEMNSWMEALKNGKSVHCQVSYSHDDESGEMEYWMKDGKVRVAGTNVSASQNEAGGKDNMINDGKAVYFWADGEVKGTKMTMPTEEEVAQMQEQAQDLAAQAPDFTDETVVNNYEDMGYKFNCQEQNVPDSEFTPPANVQFQDLSQMMQQIGNDEAMKKAQEMMGKN